MLLGNIIQNVGNSIQHEINYIRWLQQGETLASVTFTVDAGTATVTDVALSVDKTKVFFNLTDGTLGDQFNIIPCAITSLGQTRYDQISVSIQTNGGPVVLS
jgi:hypothetical protein